MNIREIGAPALLSLAALCLAGCNADRLVRGAHYELVSAGGSPLPVVLRYEGRCVHRLYGGTVEFDGRNGFKAAYDVRMSCGDSTSAVPNIGAAGHFQTRNDTAFFEDVAGHDTGHGVITADSLVVQGATHRLVFLRRTS